MSVPDAGLLLARAALLDGDDALRAWAAWKRAHSLDELDADRRTLLPMLYRNLLALDPHEPELPRLRGVYRHAWLQSQHQFRRAAVGLRVLHDAGFETLVLKGAALMVQCYRDRGCRPMADVDVLVRTARAREAAEILAAAGWRHRSGSSLSAEMAITPGTVFDDSDGGSIDLHWHSLWSPAEEDDFWQAAVPIEIGGEPTLGQCHADHLLQVCVHGLWSGDHPPARWLADATMVIRSGGQDLDWRRVVERARARSMTLAMAEALRVLDDSLGVAIPSWVLTELRTSERAPWEAAVHWAWTGRPTRLRRAVILADNYLRRRPLPPSEARPSGLAAYIDAYASLAWSVERRREIPLTAVRRLVHRELYAA